MGRKHSIVRRPKATVRTSMIMEKTAKFVEKRRNIGLSLTFAVFPGNNCIKTNTIRTYAKLQKPSTNSHKFSLLLLV